MFVPLERFNFVERTKGRFSDVVLKPPAEWMPKLSSLMEDYREGGIRSVDALLMKLVDGDAVAVMMLRHILFWQPHSIRKDGAVWRTAEEWEAHTGLSKSAVYNPKRRKRLKDAGLIAWVEKAMGEPTLHFRVDEARFTMAVCRVLGLDYQTGLDKLWESSQTKAVLSFPKAESSYTKPESSQTKIPVTTNTTTNTTNESAGDGFGFSSSDLLKDYHLSKTEREIYGALPVTVVAKCIEDCKGARKPLAYLRAALKNAVQQNTPPKENPLPEVRDGGQKIALPFVGKDWGEFEREKPSWAKDEDRASLPMWWVAARNQLELQLDKNAWSFVHRLKFRAVDGGAYVFDVPNEGVKGWVERYTRNIGRVIADVQGVRFDEVRLRFEVQDERKG